MYRAMPFSARALKRNEQKEKTLTLILRLKFNLIEFNIIYIALTPLIDQSALQFIILK